ncbi:MAG: extracellular solute-binding protein [Amphritea sp.]|nr:extracellular solute-binding protein [Amphritea sp.]
MGRLFLCWLTLLLPLAPLSAETLTVYSARSEELIKPLFDLYEKQTGHSIQYTTDKAKGLLRRLKAEGRHSPADLLITVDAGNLWFAANQGVLAEVESEILQRNIPAYLRDPENRWFGLSVRARTIIYNSHKVDQDDLISYERLADSQWQGRLCLRTSKKVYNHSLVAMLINRHGARKTEDIIRGWVANLARQPMSSDVAVMAAIENGICDIGIVNSYYFGRLQKQNPGTHLALFWPAIEHNGVHVNVSGAGVTRYAPHREQAIRFLEWLSSEQAQHLLARLNMEYPVHPQVAPSDLVRSWGAFDADTSNLSQAGKLQKYAVRLMQRAGYR